MTREAARRDCGLAVRHSVLVLARPSFFLLLGAAALICIVAAFIRLELVSDSDMSTWQLEGRKHLSASDEAGRHPKRGCVQTLRTSW